MAPANTVASRHDIHCGRTLSLCGRPDFQAAITRGMAPGWAADDGAALHFVGQGLARVVTSRPKAGAYRVECVGGEAVETPLATEYLGAPVTLVA